MCPHCPQDLWCHRWPRGIFFTFPYLVSTSMWSSGTRWTVHSPACSNSNTRLWKSMERPSGSRSNLRFLVSSTLTGSALTVRYPPLRGALPSLPRGSCEGRVDLLDHRQRACFEPYQVELDQGAFGHRPARRSGVVGLRRQCSPPEIQVHRDVFDLRSPVGKGVRLEHVGRDLGPGGHDLVDDPRIPFEGLLG